MLPMDSDCPRKKCQPGINWVNPQSLPSDEREHRVSTTDPSHYRQNNERTENRSSHLFNLTYWVGRIFLIMPSGRVSDSSGGTTSVKRSWSLSAISLVLGSVEVLILIYRCNLLLVQASASENRRAWTRDTIGTLGLCAMSTVAVFSRLYSLLKAGVMEKLVNTFVSSKKGGQCWATEKWSLGWRAVLSLILPLAITYGLVMAHITHLFVTSGSMALESQRWLVRWYTSVFTTMGHLPEPIETGLAIFAVSVDCLPSMLDIAFYDLCLVGFSDYLKEEMTSLQKMVDDENQDTSAKRVSSKLQKVMDKIYELQNEAEAINEYLGPPLVVEVVCMVLYLSARSILIVHNGLNAPNVIRVSSHYIRLLYSWSNAAGVAEKAEELKLTVWRYLARDGRHLVNDSVQYREVCIIWKLVQGLQLAISPMNYFQVTKGAMASAVGLIVTYVALFLETTPQSND